MLAASSICFICTATPSTVHSIYLILSKNLSNRQYIIHIFTNILLHFHHASNFLVFVFSCARFRTELIDLFCVYLRCPIYNHLYKRSTPHTEQVFIYSARQQKAPMKLLAPKANAPRRNTQQPYQNGILLLGANNHSKRAVRSGPHTIQPFLK